jgi:integrase
MKRGGVWHYRGVINGQLHRKSTGFSDLARARRRANEIENAIREGNLGWVRKPVPQFHVWARTFLAAYYPSKYTERILLERVITRWAGRPLDTIARSEGEMYLREREHEGAKAATLERERMLIKKLFQTAIDDDLIEKNPFAEIRCFKPQPRTRVMSPEEETRLRAILLPTWQRFMTVALLTGLRAGELRGARPIDLREGGAWLRVRPECNKTRTERLVPLRKEARDALAEEQKARNGDDADPFFPVSQAAPKAALVRACRKLEIDPGISVHDLRRTFATRCAEAGMYPKHLQLILGHKKIETTMRYYVHMERKSIADALLEVAL